ncbi:hypothetical protein DPMN_027881 [Dreissena polymorpha]|uniref:Uncharacterized protein n=1 Tax=Dreissena polymorpha TaxID=45954 RepID=A0A9D4LXX3_DREPO|nr:hypothetical protein DPMN_027881 [Dreissena polymorpha]
MSKWLGSTHTTVDASVFVRGLKTFLEENHKRHLLGEAFGLPKSRFRCPHKTGGCLFMRLDECCQAVAA